MALVTYRMDDCSGPDGVSIDGRAWSDGFGEWVVSVGDFVYESNQIRNGSVSDAEAIAYDGSLPSGLTDQRIEADVSGDGHMLVGRYSAGNYYLAHKNGSSVYLYRVDAGVPTFLDSGSWAGGSSGRLKLDIQGTLIRVYEGATLRASATDATYATGVAGIRIVLANQFFDDVEIFVDETLVTTPAPTTIPPTVGPTSYPGTTLAPTTLAPSYEVFGEGRVIVANPVINYMAGVFFRFQSGPTQFIGIEGYYGDIATDVLTGGCWDNLGNVFYAYKDGAQVRVAGLPSSRLTGVADWDVAITTMQSSDGRACIAWYDDVLYLWVHNDTAASNTPTLYRLDASDGSIVPADAGSYWHVTSGSPSASVEAANPGGKNNGHWPNIKVTASRIFMLGMEDDKTAVYLEIRDRADASLITDITLQSVTLPDEVYPRGIDIDPVNEHVFVTWGEFNDSQSRDEPNRASYDLDGTVRWSFTSYIAGWDDVGQISYDIDNDRLLLAGGTDMLGHIDESISVLNPATGGRTSGVTTPGTGQTLLGIMWDPSRSEIMVMNRGDPSLLEAYESDFTSFVNDNTTADQSRVFAPDYLYAEGAPVTSPPVTAPPVTGAPTSFPGTTFPPTTLPEPSFPVETTSPALTTAIGSTTEPVVTDPPTTAPPTSDPGTTEAPTTDGLKIRLSISYVDVQDQLVVRAWIENDERKVRDEDLSLSECELVLVDEGGVGLTFRAVADSLGDQYARFVIPNARLYADHIYMLETTLVVSGGPTAGPSAEPFPVI